MLHSLLVLTLAPAPAHAGDASPPADAPRVAVVGLHQASLDAEGQRRAVEALSAAVEADGKFDALLPEQVAAALAGREQVVLEEGLLASARQSLANGRTAFNQASWDEAASYLGNAVRDTENALPGANAVLDLWDAHLYLGTARLLQDTPDEAAARAAFVNAIALAPERPANPAQFPPDIVESFEALRKELPAEAVTLGIAADGEGTAWLDGKEVGSLPVSVPGVLPGVHYVVVRGEGTQGTARIEVPRPAEGVERETPQVRVELSTPTLAGAASSPVGRSNQTTALYTSLGKRTNGVDYVLLGGVDGELLHLQLLHVPTGTFSKAMEVPFTDAADDEAVAAVPLLLRFVGASGTFSTTSASAPPLAVGSNLALTLLLTQPPEPQPLTGPVVEERRSRTGLVLGVVGALLVGGGVGTVYAVTRPEETLPTTGTVTVHF